MGIIEMKLNLSKLDHELLEMRWQISLNDSSAETS